jgi:hypothetical protein
MARQPKLTLSAASALLLVLAAWMASSPPAVADQAQARSLLKAMTDYVGAQQSILTRLWARLCMNRRAGFGSNLNGVVMGGRYVTPIWRPIACLTRQD